MELTKEFLEEYKKQNPSKYEAKFGANGTRVKKEEVEEKPLKETKTKS